jgi:hypothetical protein
MWVTSRSRTTATYDLAGWMLGANVYGTNADKTLYTFKGKKLGETGLVLSVARTF